MVADLRYTLAAHSSTSDASRWTSRDPSGASLADGVEFVLKYGLVVIAMGTLDANIRRSLVHPTGDSAVKERNCNINDCRLTMIEHVNS
jgi:hypothetical protein